MESHQVSEWSSQTWIHPQPILRVFAPVCAFSAIQITQDMFDHQVWAGTKSCSIVP